MDLSRAGRVISQKYRLDRKLGQGGMGEVWVARHLQLDTDVALKLLVSEHAPTEGARARFEREAKTAAQVKSPHIVHVFDYGVDGETPYLAMELLIGEDLEARLRRRGRLTVSETAMLVAPVCKALRRIHEAGLVHRDLKPSNVFLARHDDEDLVKVLDFGIAKPARSAEATTSGVVVGSPPYMSPEHVLAKKELDHRTDLWSLGVIVYRALVGRLPFSAEVLTQLLVEICIAPVPRASALVPSLGPEADAFFERALSREPGERFQTAVEMGEAFAAFARGSAAKVETPQDKVRVDVAPHGAGEGVGPGGAREDAGTRGAGEDATTPLQRASSAGGDDTTVAVLAEREVPSGIQEAAAKEGIAAEEGISAEPIAIPEGLPARRREASVIPAIAIGVVAAGLLVWAASALTAAPAPAESGPAARPKMASGPEVASGAESGSRGVGTPATTGATGAGSAPTALGAASAPANGVAASARRSGLAPPGPASPNAEEPAAEDPAGAFPSHGAPARETPPTADAPARDTPAHDAPPAAETPPPPAPAADAGPGKTREFW